MFSLHETTRTHVCRAAFIALCLVPTCAVAAWCVWVNASSFRHSHERAIRERLGWQARLVRVSLPRPGVTLYEGLELSDPDNGQLLAQVPFAEISARGDAISVTLPFPAKINGRRLDVLAKAAERLLRTRDDWTNVSFEANTITLHLADGDQTLASLAGQMRNNEDGAGLKLKFNLATASQSAAQQPTAELTVTRAKDSSRRFAFELTTGGAPLPVSLIASTWPTAARLGKASTFDGKATVTGQPSGWKLLVAGRLAKIDLERLVGQFPHKLTGMAEVEIARAAIENGRLESATGKLTGGPGAISRSLIQAAQANLQLAAAPVALAGRDNRLAYKRLSLAFEIDAGGLKLGGDSGPAAGAVLVDDSQVLVRQTSDTRVPVVNLLRTMVPQTAVQVPATRETSGLAQILPIPPLVPPPGSETPLPQAKGLRVAPPR